jgi:hypothetical protein
MSRVAFLLLAAGLASCASTFPGEKKMEDVRFVVNFQPSLGFNFENQSDRFILPEFKNETNAYAVSREWQRGIDEGHFDKGLSLFCRCKGNYLTRDGRIIFEIAEAKLYFDKFSGWDQD